MPLRYVAIALASGVIYIILSVAMGLDLLSYGTTFGLHELRVFSAFFLTPLALLAYWRDVGGIFGGWRAFFLNLGLYTLFLPIMAVLFPTLGTAGQGAWTYATATLPVALQVMSMDFFVRRVVQRPVTVELGPIHGIIAGIVVWVLAHVLEIMALGPLYGWWQIGLLVGVSGIVLAPAYAFTRDVSGQMAGHILINLVFMALY